MTPGSRHAWDVSPAEAVALQQALAGEVIAEDQLPKPVTRVAGVDVGFEDRGWITRAAVAVLRLPELAVETTAIARRPTVFPYVPGLLSFREIPAVLDALAELDVAPDLVLCDGQGRAHPRRFGIACHLGVLTGLATIGVGKSRLTGHHAPVGEDKGQQTPLWDRDEEIGVVLRTRTRVRPVYVSSGHRVGLASAVGWVLRCTPRYRLPEPLRHAHRLASG